MCQYSPGATPNPTEGRVDSERDLLGGPFKGLLTGVQPASPRSSLAAEESQGWGAVSRSASGVGTGKDVAVACSAPIAQHPGWPRTADSTCAQVQVLGAWGKGGQGPPRPAVLGPQMAFSRSRWDWGPSSDFI